MLHGFDYPDETGVDELRVRLWHAIMHDGVIEYPTPQDCPQELKRFIKKMKAKQFTDTSNFSGTEEPGLDESLSDGGEST